MYTSDEYNNELTSILYQLETYRDTEIDFDSVDEISLDDISTTLDELRENIDTIADNVDALQEKLDDESEED